MNQKETSELLTVVAVDEEEGAEYKVKQISNSEWCDRAVQKQSLIDVLQIRCQACNFIKETPKQVFSYEIYKILKSTFFYLTPSLWWRFLAVNSLNQ